MATKARTFDYHPVDGRHSAGNRVRTDMNPARAQIPEISRRVDRLRGVSRHDARQSQAGSNDRESTPLPQEAARRSFDTNPEGRVPPRPFSSQFDARRRKNASRSSGARPEFSIPKAWFKPARFCCDAR